MRWTTRVTVRFSAAIENMEKTTRVLFVSGEIEPFVSASEIATIARYLPQHLHESGSFEVRIMVPRYGTISERRNRLHEVIRLCGTPVKMGSRTEILKVKVASIPGIRMQVYFMDNNHFFKRKGLHKDKQGVVFEDNAARSLFFARAVLETVRKLRWKPDVVHAFGWISGMVPLLVSDELQGDELLQGAKVVYTPDDIEAQATLTSDLISTMNLSPNGEAAGLSLRDIGIRHAHVTAFPSSVTPETDRHVQFSAERESMVAQAIELYSA